MTLDNHTHCRLCADLTPADSIIRCEDETYSDINEKLERINAFTDFNDEVLPKSICLACVHSLDTAYEFVLKIEQAQEKLRHIFVFKSEFKDEPISFGSQGSIDDHEPENKPEPVLKIEKKMRTYSKLKPEYNFTDGNYIPKPVYESENEDSDKDVKKKILSKTKAKRIEKESSIPSSTEQSWNDYIWKCTVCDTQFSSFGELKSHSLQYHSICNAFRCVDCNIRKLRLDRFLVHIRSHRSCLKLICFKCDARFPTPNKEIIHRSDHKTSEYVCPGCHTEFDNLEDFTKHKSDYYQERKGNPFTQLKKKITDKLTCLLCKKIFKQIGHLNKHLLLHLQEERKKGNICDRCGKCFSMKVELTKHLMKHDNIRPFPCKICNKAFITKKHLRIHVGGHENKKPFACEQCGRCFRLRDQLVQHKKVHMDILSHACTMCDKRFRHRSHLTQHIRLHTGVKPYTCEICPRDFTNWPNYNKHMKRMHNMDMSKKKRNKDGTSQANAACEVFMQTKEFLEWKNELMNRKKIAPRVNSSNTEASDTGMTETIN